MKFMTKKIRKWVLRFCAFLLPVTAFFSQTVSAAPSNVSVTLNVSQNITTEDGTSASGTFTYRITAATPDAVLPAGSFGDTYTFSMKGTDSETIGPLEFTQPGTYSYELVQVTDQKEKSYVYDMEMYRITIYIDDEMHANTVIRKSNGFKTQKMLFHNKASSAGKGNGGKEKGNTGKGIKTPKTGDDTKAALLLIAMGAAAFVAFICALCLRQQRHRKEKN